MMSPVELPPPPTAAQPIVGTLALLPLPGSDGWRGLCTLQKKALLERVEQEAYALISAGVDAICVENSHDFPFGSNPVGRVDAAVATLMTQAVSLVGQLTEKPIGVSVLQNDPETALAVAVATDAQFIRVPVLLGTRVTETGMMPSRVQALTAAYRRWQVSPEDIAPWVDVTMHHVMPLANTHRPWANPYQYLTDMLLSADAQPLTAKLVVRQQDLMPPEAISVEKMKAEESILAQWGRQLAHPLMVELSQANLPAETLATLVHHSTGIVLESHLLRKPPLHSTDTTPAVDAFALESLIQAIRQIQQTLPQQHSAAPVTESQSV